MIALGCDHGGYELIQEIKNIWKRKEWNIKISDVIVLNLRRLSDIWKKSCQCYCRTVNVRMVF